MKIFLSIAFIISLTFLQAQTHEEIAKTFVENLSQQKYADAESVLDNLYKMKVSQKILTQFWSRAIEHNGNFIQIDSIVSSDNSNLFVYINFEKAQQKFLIHITSQNKISRFAPKERTIKMTPSNQTTTLSLSDLPSGIFYKKYFISYLSI